MPSSPPRTALLGLAAALALGTVVATPAAQAATPTRGTTTLTLTGSAGKSLQKATAPQARGQATRRGSTVRLPVRGGSVTAGLGIVDHEGRLVLRTGKRKLALADFRVTVRNGSSISAVVRGKRQRLFVVRSTAKQRKLNATAGTIGLSKATVTLTATGAKTLRRHLTLPKLRGGQLGAVTVDARLGARAPDAQAPAPAPTPPPPTATARPVVSATLTWRQRTSWMQYVDSGRFAGTSADPEGGTTVLPPAVGHVEPLPRPGTATPLFSLPYAASYPFVSGWYDPTNGTGAVRFSGGIRHRYTTHTIDYTASDPEIVLAGAQAQLVATLQGNATSPLDARTGYVALDMTKAQTSSNGGTVSFTGIPGTLSSADGAFSGFYTDGESFGSVDQLVLDLGG